MKIKWFISSKPTTEEHVLNVLTDALQDGRTIVDHSGVDCMLDVKVHLVVHVTDDKYGGKFPINIINITGKEEG